MDVLQIVELGATRPALLLGSLPPAGRDYDILLHDVDRCAVEAALRSNGFMCIDRRFVRLAADRADVVDLLTVGDLCLPESEIEELFERTQPLSGHARIGVPAPAHQVLLLARKLPRTPGLLEDHHLQRLARALASEADAFEQAHKHARAWGVESRLASLRSRYEHPTRARALARMARSRRRGAIVALSGLDGVGKSTQAMLLRNALERFGYTTRVVWTPLGSGTWVRGTALGIKKLLARLPSGPLARAEEGTVERRLLSQTSRSHPADWRLRGLAVWIWATVLSLANAASFRWTGSSARAAGRVVIYDRYVLDSIVELRFSYSPHGRLPAQEAFIRRIAPTADCALVLTAEPELVHARKPDWSLSETRLRAELYRAVNRELGASVLDASLSPDELASQILEHVLQTLVR